MKNIRPKSPLDLPTKTCETVGRSPVATQITVRGNYVQYYHRAANRLVNAILRDDEYSELQARHDIHLCQKRCYA